MGLFADIGNPAPVDVDPANLWLLVAMEVFLSALSLPYFLFWIWMLVHCYRTEPDRFFWIWIMVIVQPIGSIAYFLLRYIPSKEFPTPGFLRRWTRGSELLRLESAAEQIGNPHQFVLWGDALRECGQLDRARAAYERALKKDPQDLRALWGAAQIARDQKRFADVASLTKQVLDRDPQYKFGDVSLAYGRALTETGDVNGALAHFEEHVKRWRHPEGVYLLSKLHFDQGNHGAARQHLVAMIRDIDSSPRAISRKFGRWKSRGKQLLRKLKA